MNPETEFPLQQVLDENGKLVGDRSQVTDDELKDFYRWLVLLRTLDQRAWNLQRQGRIGTYAPFSGQEAAQIGAAAALNKGDWLCPSYRDWGALIYAGVPLYYPFLNAMGNPVSGKIPDDVNALPVQVVIAAQILHSVGLAWSSKLQNQNRVAIPFFGDGATSQGDFHEALNLAAVVKAPVVFVCQNNQWAISVPISRQMNTKTIAQRALAYDIEGVRVDGNDIIAMYQTLKQMVAHARSGAGPVLVEAVTYRLGAHTTADDPTRYRESEEAERLARREPISRLKTYLQEAGLLSEEDIQRVDEEAKADVEDAVKKAEQYPKMAPESFFDNVYETMTDPLKKQRGQFQASLAQGGVTHG